MSRIAQWAAMLLLISPMSQAQGPAYMVKDIKTEQGPFADVIFWGFGDAAEFEGYGYFRGNDGVHGEELWRWSPTSEPEMMVDICPGVCSSYPIAFVAAGGRLFFVAWDGSHGFELWATDGTAVGTRLLRDISIDTVGQFGGAPQVLTAVGERIFFAAGPQSSGQELWVSDGTPQGTVPVADIRPGPEGSNPRSLVDLDGVLYFTADDGRAGREVWRSDGTERGTELVLDLCAGEADCFWEEQWVPWGARILQPLGGRLLVRSGANGPEALWSLDPRTGTVESLTTELGSVWAPAPVLDGRAYFNACEGWNNCELWSTDGTASGTERVRDIRPGDQGSHPFMLGALDDVVLFYASGDDGEGRELWRTDGTAAGTDRVLDIYPGPASSRPIILLAPGSRLGDTWTFTADDGVHGAELWATDGSAAGTFMLADANPGPGGAFLDWFYPQHPVAVEGRLGFQAIHQPLGFRFWQSDGTPAGTELLGDLDDQASSVSQSLLYGPDLRAGAGRDRLFFAAVDDEHGSELWTSDGSAAGTRLVADLAPGVGAGGLPNSSRPLRFSAGVEPAFVGSVVGVFASDGSEAGTEQLVAEGGDSAFRVVPGWDGDGAPAVFFAVDQVLYVSDGTSLGTEALADEAGHELEWVGDRLLFSRFGNQIWRTEGSVESTVRVATIFGPGGNAGIRFLGSTDGNLLFRAEELGSGSELWRSDGTSAGTEQVADIRPGAEGSEPGVPEYGRAAAVTSRGVFFTADDGASGRELWVSDGHPDGTFRVIDLRPGGAGSHPSDLTALGDRVFFFADDGASGRELWVTDGRPDRARRVRDIRQGSASSLPIRRLGSRMIAAEKRVVFAATDGESGVELWTSDGTDRGTYRLHDIHPGPGSSSPHNFVRVGDCLYFSATDGEHGFELWALPLSSSPGGDCAAVERSRIGSIFDR